MVKLNIMKKLFLIVFILISVQSFSQLVQYPTNYGVIYRRGGADTILQVPSDTFTVPASLISKSHIAIKNGTLYRWNGSAWVGLSGGSTDTTSLSNRINLKLNISDTATMLTNYVNGVGYALLKSGQVIRADSATLANYFLRRKDSATGTNLNGYLTRTSVRTYSPGIDDVLAVGQALTDDRSIDVSGNDFEIINANEISIKSLDDGVYIRSDGLGLTSFIRVENDSITIAPNMGKINIDSLRAGGTSEDSVMVISSGGMVRKRNAADFGGSNTDSLFGVQDNLIVNDRQVSFSDGSFAWTGLPERIDTSQIYLLTIDRNGDKMGYLPAFPIDTISIASFGGGGGQAGDTTTFSTSTIYGSFYNDGSDTLVITSIRAVLQGSSPSLVPTVYFNDSLNVTAGATKLVNSPATLTNTATGASATPDNKKIPPGVWVWVKTETVTTKPTYFSLTILGYKKRR